LPGALGGRHAVAGQVADLLGGFLAAFGQLAHLGGHHRKALAVLAGAGGLDGGVQRQQVGLVGDVVDDADLGAICFIAPTVCVTASPPSAASWLALVAMPSVTLALSLFCVIEADIMSIDAVVSFHRAACSLAACDRLCAVALTWLAAPVSASAAARTSSMTSASLSQLAVGVVLDLVEDAFGVARDALAQVAVGQAREHAAHVLDDAGQLLAGGVGVVLQLAEGALVVARDALRQVAGGSAPNTRPTSEKITEVVSISG
jgi:hypothetical protein